MSGLRCWPQCLAYITHPSMYGKPLTCLYLVERGLLTLPDGFPGSNTASTPAWMVQFTEPVSAPVDTGFGISSRMAHYAVIEDKWLKPLLPPPGAADTPTTADKPQPVEAV